jgi:hypothetical protein
MINFIDTIIKKIGGRPAGSEAEINAQLFFKEEAEKISNNVVVDEFKASFSAKFESLKLFCILFYISLSLYWLSLTWMSILSTISTVVFLIHFFSYYDILDFIFPKKKSINVYGDIEPEEEVKSTILISGHMDSVYEFQWWKKLGELGGLLTLLSGVLFLLYSIFALVLISTTNHHTFVFNIIWIVFAILSPITITFFFMHGKHIVDGASDNLSGVAIALYTAKSLIKENEIGKSILKHTRIRFVSFAAEEPGLKGSGAFVKKHKNKLHNENAILINIDGIRVTNQLTIIKGESNTFVKYPHTLINELHQSFIRKNIPVKKEWLNLGATDATRFHRAGIPSLTIVGMDTKKLDPCYHTRLDTVENLSREALEATKSVLIDYIIERDKKLH